MLERTHNIKSEILYIEFQRIVKDEIEAARRDESLDPENIHIVQLESDPEINFLLPFPFFVPQENFRYGSYTYTENGNKQLENGLADMGVVYEKNTNGEKTFDYNPM